jgi:hypothetical protein
MAQEEHDREDLLREATALVERVELDVPGEPAPIVAGFRRDGSLSVYFGGDPVYQFNAAGELRRAFVGGLLYKAERGRLVELTRHREAGQVVLARRELTEVQACQFIEAMARRLAGLRSALAAHTIAVRGQVPQEADVLRRVAEWLVAHEQFAVARTPRARR